MATTIGTVAPYKKGSPPDFGTLYSGRALTFDGVSDYVSVANSLDFRASGNIPNYTISFWINPTAIANNDKGIMSVGNSITDGSASWIIQRDAGVLKWLNQTSTHTIGTMIAGKWNHVAITYNGTDTKTYFDGVLASSTTETPAHASRFDYLYMGTGYNGYFDGNLSNVQIWDEAWSLSDVQYAYTHPEKLVTDRQGGGVFGLASFNISNLKAWYPCTEGNPASPQTTVYDGSPKELGSEIITGNNSTFDSGYGDWVVSNSDTSIEAIGGALKVSRVGSSGSVSVQVKLELSSSMKTTGTIWRWSWDIWKDTDSTYFEGSMAGSSGTVGKNIMDANPVSTTRQSYYGYVTQSSTGDMYFNCAMGDGVTGSYYLDNVSVKEVQMGNHGTTTFTEVIEEDDASSDNTSNWTVAGASATKIFDTDHYDHGNEGINSYFYNTFSGTSGAQYEVVFKIVNNNATADFDVNATYYNGSSYTEGTTKTIDSTSVSYTTVRHTFTADATSGSSRWGLRVQSDLGRKKVSVKDLSITQIGVASGWTTADAEPLIPQTALMGMSKPLVMDGIDDEIEFDSSITFSTGDSISLWVIPEEVDNYRSFFGKDATHAYIRMKSGNESTQIEGETDTNGDMITINAGQTIFTVGELTHMVLVWQSDKTWDLYINGSFMASSSATTDTTLLINKLGSGYSSYPFMGIMNEVSIWDKTLSLEEIQELFNDGVALDATTHTASSNLTGYWRNDGASSWEDRKGSNDGTPAGSPDTILLPEGTTSDKDILGFPLTHTNNGWLNLKGNTYTTSSVNADGSLVSITDNDILDIESAITVEAWLRVDHIGNEMYAICKDTDQSYALKITNSGVFKGVVYTAGGRVDYSTTDTAVVGTWYHIAMTYDGANVKMYKDSVLKTTTAETTNIVKTTQPLRIGAYGSYATGGNYSWEGQIDELKIYNRALSAIEISKNWKHGKGKH